MRSNKLLTRAIALALSTMSTMACAVSLGDLTVQSRPGEPMQATLQIDDLDLSISPLLVRVAPPSTYLRVGVPWAQPVQDLRLVRDGSQSMIRVKVVGSNPIPAQSFPLLIELNAGGKISVRNYQIVARNGRFEVLEGTVAPSPSSPVMAAVPAAATKPVVETAHKAETKAESKAEAKAEEKVAVAKTEAKTETKAKSAEHLTTSSAPSTVAAAPVVPVTSKAAEKPALKVSEPSTENSLASLGREVMPASNPKAAITSKAPMTEKTPAKVAEKAVEAPVVEKAPEKVAEKASDKAPEKVAAKVKAAPAPMMATASTTKHRAPEIVREYVALNGFDATQPFHVQRSMTLWSVAKLYWPSYRGATLEQLLIAFRNRNPSSFVKGKPDVLMSGYKLMPPSEKEVFAIDPAKAFREIHGAHTPVPPPTQNLIDAQKVSSALAGSVADAQDRERTEGKNENDIDRAGRATLENGKHLIAENEEAAKSAVAASGLATVAEKLENSAVEKAEKAAEESADKVAEEKTQAKVEAAVASAEKAADATQNVQVDASTATTPAAVPVTEHGERPQPAGNDDAADAMVTSLAAGKTIEATKGFETVKKEGATHTVTTTMEPAANTPAPNDKPAVAAQVSEAVQSAQTQAAANASVPATPKDAVTVAAPAEPVKAEVEKATKPAPTSEEPSLYWWAGLGALALMLIGWLIKTRRPEDEADEDSDKKQGVLVKSEIKPASAAALEAVEKTVDEAVKNGTTAGAMGVGSMAYSEALQKELKAEEAAKKGEDISLAVKEGGEPATFAGKAAQPSALAPEKVAEGGRRLRPETSKSSQPWLDPQDDSELPPMEHALTPEALAEQSEKANMLIQSVSLNLDDPQTPAQPATAATPAAKTLVNNKELALKAALEAKYNLAKSFVGIGALNEALELLDEVRRRGTPDQRERAAELAATIPLPSEQEKA